MYDYSSQLYKLSYDYIETFFKSAVNLFCIGFTPFPSFLLNILIPNFINLDFEKLIKGGGERQPQQYRNFIT